MTAIIPERLWISHAIRSDDYRALMDLEIQAIVQLALEEPPLQPPRELIYFRIPLIDGAGNEPNLIHYAVEILEHLIDDGVRTVVCCGAGMSRSPALVSAAIAQDQQFSLVHGLEQVARVHHCDVSPGLWNDLTSLLGQPSGKLGTNQRSLP